MVLIPYLLTYSQQCFVTTVLRHIVFLLNVFCFSGFNRFIWFNIGKITKDDRRLINHINRLARAAKLLGQWRDVLVAVTASLHVQLSVVNWFLVLGFKLSALLTELLLVVCCEQCNEYFLLNCICYWHASNVTCFFATFEVQTRFHCTFCSFTFN